MAEYAISLGYLKKNPFDGLKRLRTGNRLDKWLPKQQVDVLVGECSGMLRNIVEFFALTGARLNEGLVFNVSNINSSRTEFKVLTEKKKRVGEHYRWFNMASMGPRFDALMNNMKPHPETGYFFHNKHGGPLSDSYVEHCFAKVRIKAGLADRKLHDLRHTFCMHRAMVVKNFRQLQTEMGHSSPASIQKYLAEAQRYDITESIFYTENQQLEVLGEEQKRPEKRPTNIENTVLAGGIK